MNLQLIDDRDELGYVLETKSDKIGTVFFLMENGKTCCETWDVAVIVGDTYAGCLPKSFLKQEANNHLQSEPLTKLVSRIRDWTIESVSLSDTRVELDYGNIIGVTAICSQGTIKFFAWSEHDGYYPHNVSIKWNGFADDQLV